MRLFAIWEINTAYSLSTSTVCAVQCESLQRAPKIGTQVYVIEIECTY